jgi:(p)ppGpp synthase/HD superfamily hydrolase
MHEQVRLAEKIAREAHAGQTRRDGTPYIAHPERVFYTVKDFGDLAGAVAWLHDVTEDTKLTPADLVKMGVDWEIATIVRILDKTEYGDVHYEYYLKQVAKNPIAKRVKVADIFDNLTDAPTDKQKMKYQKALMLLVGE